MSTKVQRDPDILKAPEVAGLLGMATSTVYSMADRGEIPAIRIGASLRFRRSTLLNFLSQKEEQAFIGTTRQAVG